MSKPFHYWTRFTLAITLSATLVVSPVWAGRILKGRKARAAECCVVAPPVCCEYPVVESYGNCCNEVVQSADPCGCDGDVISEMPLVSPASPATQEHAVPATPEPAPAPETEPLTPKTEQPSEATPPPVIESEQPETTPKSPFNEPAPEETPTTPDPIVEPAPAPPEENLSPEPAPAPQPNTPAEDPLFPTEPSPAPQPNTPAEDPLFPAEPALVPETTTPVEPAPAPGQDDLFGTPSETPKTPAADAGEDLFGAPSTPAPSTPAPSTPAPTTPAADEDLFGTPSTPDEPAPVPSQDDDLFGTPEAKAPAEPAAPPATDPSLDSLFDTPSAPAEKAPATDPADSLFDTPAEPKINEEGKTDNLFDSTSTEAPVSEDLFGTPVSKPDQPLEQAAPPATKNQEDLELELDKLFDSSDARTPSSDFNGAELRVWVDNTGNFTTTGRLLTIFANEVRLLKENGKTTTVPIRRLSEADMNYVKRVYTALNKNTNSKEFFVQHEPAEQVNRELTR